MDPKRIVALVVGASVMVLIFSALLVPIINDATKTTGILENTGYYEMQKYGVDDSITISWDHTKPKVITVNDEEIPVEGLPINQWVSLVAGDTWGLRYANGGTLFFTSFAYGTMQSIGASTQDNKDLTIVCENGTATATTYASGTPGTPVTTTYTNVYAIANEGNYVMKKSGETAYMSEDSPIFAFGQTTLGTGYSCMVTLSGTVEDVSPTILASTSGAAEVVDDSLVVNTTALTNYVGYALDTIEFEVNDRDTDYPVTYSYFIVPAEVTLELTVHPDSATNALLSAIPIIAMIGIVLAVVGVAIVGRNDY